MARGERPEKKTTNGFFVPPSDVILNKQRPNGGTYEEKVKAIEAALRNLNIPRTIDPDKPNAIPYSFVIPGIARDIVFFALTGPGTPPRLNSASAKTVEKELASLKRGAEQLLTTLNAMHAPTLAALGLNESWPNWPRGIEGLSFHLNVLVIAASTATIAPDDHKPEMGRPRNERAARVAERIATEYLRLTGSKPTLTVSVDHGSKAGGPFYDLLASIFEAVGIKASAEVWAKHAIAALEESPTKTRD
jgi:hypothetical protein